MSAWIKRVVALAVCLALLAGPAVDRSAARERDKRSRLVFTTFPNEGMGLLFKRILTEAYERIDCDVEILSVPAGRALVMSDRGESDGEAARGPVAEDLFENLIRVPTVLYTNAVVAFAKNREIDVAAGWGALAPYKLGSVIGYKFIEKETTGYDRTLVSCHDKLFLMLQNDRLDVALTGYLDVMASLNDFDLEEICLLSPPLARIPMYHYLHKKHADLVPLIDTSLRQMREEGRMDAILNEILVELGTTPDQFCPISRAY